MVRDLMIAIGCLVVAIIGTVLIIEGLVYGDEQERRQSGTAERAEIARLMDYHGADCVYEKDGQLYFDRNGKRIRIGRMP